MQDQFTTLISQIQGTTTGPLRTWADSVERLSGGLGTPGPDLAAVVDAFFDLAEQVLATQREIAKAVVRAATPQ